MVRASGSGVEDFPHGDHVGVFEAVFAEEVLGFGADLVGEEGDALEVFLFGEIEDVFEEAGAVALAAVVRVDDDVFHEDDESATGGGDGEEEVHHAEDLVVVAEDEDAAAVGLFEDELEAAFLDVAVG